MPHKQTNSRTRKEYGPETQYFIDCLTVTKEQLHAAYAEAAVSSNMLLKDEDKISAADKSKSGSIVLKDESKVSAANKIKMGKFAVETGGKMGVEEFYTTELEKHLLGEYDKQYVGLIWDATNLKANKVASLQAGIGESASKQKANDMIAGHMLSGKSF